MNISSKMLQTCFRCHMLQLQYVTQNSGKSFYFEFFAVLGIMRLFVAFVKRMNLNFCTQNISVIHASGTFQSLSGSGGGGGEGAV